ncbi:TldD/PmbA family protein [Pseudobacteriovorax antillogorgiicola]|uniref:Predicted Zn-dependent protease or its inactivated homolog n=1 Tax=Pseudobacteriovorax antillogorgiicola TaxID=1513793 RepID=A0A1Y6BM06_9BACT|nr:TldD/PmbA family protein [Pseudobacteriovorax antillogorgiicola]TCS54687.1 putative Zn-dependent protease [Pseudobacteriovorax antillogorgiicola]SMF16519.1 Predicted Zn-dependent protease or its inactivated homolog [Pseudobacteriovorax antillogorgiicola]
MNQEQIRHWAKGLPTADYWSLRVKTKEEELLELRNSKLSPPQYKSDTGYMITVFSQSGQGYAASSDMSEEGLHAAFKQAKEWAELSAKQSIYKFDASIFPGKKGSYSSPGTHSMHDYPLDNKIELLHAIDNNLGQHPKTINKEIGFWFTKSHTLNLSSNGDEIEKRVEQLCPTMSVTVFDKGEVQNRSVGRHSYIIQGGVDEFMGFDLGDKARQISQEALELLKAPICPSESMDLLIDTDLMVLTIHESIGHPLELDRILGDERNYAGTSFVRPEMFGNYRYGSDLLNISFDPTIEGESASYNFDDDGTPAEKVYLIKEGILQAGIGGRLSQLRSGLPGSAASRSSDWNRPTLDRMANINLEPGQSSMEQLVSRIEKGILMRTNCSWSIDDSRNKFQFGAEYGQLIEDGKLTTLVRKPNYRGISAQFWRNLAAVGDSSTFKVHGSPYCGKAEPNQSVNVGHASPPCVFSNVEVFGGD